jgi:hypothetical protein
VNTVINKIKPKTQKEALAYRKWEAGKKKGRDFENWHRILIK